MALTIVTGGANAGKTGVAHSAIRDAQARGERTLLLLPSKPEVSRAVSEFSTGHSALGIKIAQFDDYLSELWTLIGDGRKLVRETQRTLLVNKVLGSVALPLLSRSAGRPGFVRLIEGLVQRAGEGMALDGHRAELAQHPVAREILGVVDAYAGLLEESRLIESAEAAIRLADHLGRQDIPDLIVINRMSGFTRSQERFIERASILGCEVLVALTWIEGHPATLAADDTVARLIAIPGTIRTEIAEPEVGEPELRAMSKWLFSGVRNPQGMVSTGTVTLSEAAGSAGEAARITRDIQEMEISGISRGDICVVYRHPERHIDRLVAALEEAGIPADLDVRIPATSSGLGRALLLLLGYACRGYNRADLMGFLRSGYSWAEPELVDEADERLRQRRCGSGKDVVACARSVGPKARLLLERAERLSELPIDAVTVDGWRWLIADMLRASCARDGSLNQQNLLDAAVQRTVMAAIEEIAALGHGGSARDLLSVVQTAPVTLAPIRTRSDHVQVMSAERARSLRFSAVILAGLNVGEFPALPPEDALSARDLSEALLMAGIDISPRVDADAERLLFYQVVTGARERLVLSRTVCDDDGKPTRPSSLWEEFLDLYRDPASGAVYGETAVPLHRLELGDLAEAEDAPRAERRRLRAAASSGQSDEDRVRYALWRTRPRRGQLSDEVAARLAVLDTFSATEIEMYLSCPFRWFYDSKLRPESLDRQIDVLERGTLAHDIMRRFYEARRSAGLGRVTPANLAEALEQYPSAVDAALEDSPQPMSLRDAEMLRGAIAGGRRIVERDATFLPGFEPLAHEHRFGANANDLMTRIGDFFLKGRIDRVDSCEAGIAVIDYKGGSTVAKMADFEAKGLVQLPLYGLIASREFGRPIVAGLYRSMQYGGDRGFFRSDVVDSQGLVSTDKCDAEQVEALVNDAVDRAARAVSGMRAGRISAEPHDKNACRFCSAASICGGSDR